MEYDMKYQEKLIFHNSLFFVYRSVKFLTLFQCVLFAHSNQLLLFLHCQVKPCHVFGFSSDSDYLRLLLIPGNV